MFNILKRTLVSVSLTVCCSGVFNGGASKLVDASSEVGQAATASDVEITFNGLMVFHSLGDHYEVGLLAPAAAPDHQFSITVIPNPGRIRFDDARLNHLKSLGNNWTLDIENRGAAAATPGITVRNRGRSGRLAESDANKDDFSWIIDMDGPEFHNSKLDMKPKMLSPIIQLNTGTLRVKFKSDELQRKQGLTTGTYRDFGFIAETVALTLVLQPGEELVLKVPGQGADGEVFKLKAGRNYQIDISNAPGHDQPKVAGEPSHFQLYYNLFPGITNPQKFEFRAKELGRRSKNHLPGDRFATTFDNQSCGSVVLSRADALQ